MYLPVKLHEGYAMVALLVAMSVMAIMMTVVMPVWRQTNQREKETELVFRGLQYARAVGLYEKKFANTPPPSIDVLVQQRYLRKKYKDPITNDDFVPVLAGQLAATQPGQQPAAPAVQTTAASVSGNAGVTGVASKSTATSIRVYKGRTHYNEWLFVYAPAVAAPGAGGGGTGAPGQRGGQPQQGGQPGVGIGGRGNRGGQGPGGPSGPERGPGGPGGPGGGARGQGGPTGTPAPFNPFQLPTDVGPGRGR